MLFAQLIVHSKEMVSLPTPLHPYWQRCHCWHQHYGIINGISIITGVTSRVGTNANIMVSFPPSTSRHNFQHWHYCPSWHHSVSAGVCITVCISITWSQGSRGHCCLFWHWFHCWHRYYCWQWCHSIIAGIDVMHHCLYWCHTSLLVLTSPCHCQCQCQGDLGVSAGISITASLLALGSLPTLELQH